MQPLEIVFWLLVAIVAWTYAGYPLFIAALARLRPQPVVAGDDWRPTVSVVIAVRNERDAVARRVANLLDQDYPADRLTVVVACNGSTDGTEDVVRELARHEPRVRVLVSLAAQGKAGALNLALAECDAELVVFADARQTFERDAVSRLVEPFADAAVGAVTGRLVVRRAMTASVEGVRLYWGMETQLRAAESRSGSVVGATGAIYAVRRALFAPVPSSLILDDVYVPMRIAMRGFRVVMAPGAVAYDVPARDRQQEYARKRRTMVGNIQLVRAIPALLVPWRNPLFFRFLSHKVLRLLTPVCCLALLATSALLPGPFYRLCFVAALTGYAAGVLGLLVNVPLLSIPAAFVMIHGAILSALLRWRQDASQVWVRQELPRGVNDVTEVARAAVGGANP